MDPSQFPGLPPGGGPGQQVPGLPMPGMPPGYPLPPPYLQQYAAAQAQAEQLRRFWVEMKEDVMRAGTDPLEFKNQQLPLARIKKIMKSDEDVRMISAEAPVLFAKACEFFILELTLRAWGAAEETKRRTLQRSDIATAIARTDIFDFLVDTVPREEANPPPATTAPAPGAPGGAPGMQLYPGMPPQFMQGAMMQQQAAAVAAAAAAAAGQQLPNGSAGPPVGMPNAPGSMAMYGGYPLPPMYMPPQAQQAGAAGAARQQQQQAGGQQQAGAGGGGQAGQ